METLPSNFFAEADAIITPVEAEDSNPEMKELSSTCFSKTLQEGCGNASKYPKRAAKYSRGKNASIKLSKKLKARASSKNRLNNIKKPRSSTKHPAQTKPAKKSRISAKKKPDQSTKTKRPSDLREKYSVEPSDSEDSLVQSIASFSSFEEGFTESSNFSSSEEELERSTSPVKKMTLHRRAPTRRSSHAHKNRKGK